jgi:hypothetical protein
MNNPLRMQLDRSLGKCRSSVYIQKETIKIELRFFSLYEKKKKSTNVNDIGLIGIDCGFNALAHPCIHLRQICSYSRLAIDDIDDKIFLLINASNTVESNADEKSERK